MGEFFFFLEKKIFVCSKKNFGRKSVFCLKKIGKNFLGEKKKLFFFVGDFFFVGENFFEKNFFVGKKYFF